MGDSSAPPRLRSRQCMFVLYPESQQSSIDYCKQNLPCAWALHDKDVYSQASYDSYIKKHDGEKPEWQPGDVKKPHVHFVCSFPNARYFSGIAKEIGVETNVIRKVNNLYKAYVYLWHQNDPDKYQYEPDIVGLHDFDPPAQNEGVTEEEQVETMFNAPVFSTVKELARWAYDNGCWSTFRKNYGLWKDIQDESKGGTENA